LPSLSVWFEFVSFEFVSFEAVPLEALGFRPGFVDTSLDAACPFSLAACGKLTASGTET
jgi:hypothetical protein